MMRCKTFHLNHVNFDTKQQDVFDELCDTVDSIANKMTPEDLADDVRDMFFHSLRVLAFQRLSLDLNNVELRPSRIHGRGVFARRNLSKGDLITCFPTNLILLTKDPTANCFALQEEVDLITTQFAKDHAEEIAFANQYRLFVGEEQWSVAALPSYCHSNAWIGHFINDGAKLTVEQIHEGVVHKDPKSLKAIELYSKLSIHRQNCCFRERNGLFYVVATCPIFKGDECLASWGLLYWASQKAIL